MLLNNLLCKVIAWRILATIITLLGVYAFTGSLSVSVGAAIVLAVAKTGAHYLFEYLWESYL